MLKVDEMQSERWMFDSSGGRESVQNAQPLANAPIHRGLRVSRHSIPKPKRLRVFLKYKRPDEFEEG